MARDIGSYFDQLKRRAQGGRRQDQGSSTPSTGRTTPEPAPPSTTRRPTSKPSGGLADVLKDMLGKGKSAGTKAADAVRERTTTSPRRELPPETTVSIEYSPQRDGDPDPGEVVWAWVPFEEDPSQGKDRPVVIIGRRNAHLVGIPLTTKRNSREAQVNLGTGDWDPKRRTSYARVWRLLELDDASARREGSALDRRRFEQLITAVDEYYDISRAPAPKAESFDYDY